MLDKPDAQDFGEALFYPMDNLNGPCWRRVFERDVYDADIEDEEERIKNEKKKLEDEEAELECLKNGLDAAEEKDEKGIIRQKLEDFVLNKLEVTMKKTLKEKTLELLSLKLYLVQIAIREAL